MSGDVQAMRAKTRTVKQRKATPAVAAASNVPADPVVALQDRTWGIAEEWAQLGWPWLSQLIKGAVALSKAER